MACKINVVVLDKTGTIIQGKPEVIDSHWFESEIPMSRNVLFTIEKLSDHLLIVDNEATVVLFGDKEHLLAAFAIANVVKPTSVEAINELQKGGVDVYMMTGDNEQTAKAIAQQTSILHFKARVIPADKAKFVNELQHQGKEVAMVGDDINDSAALAQADISIAMGQGSDIALDVAKMTFISSDLLKIRHAMLLSKHTVAPIRQNLFGRLFKT